MTYQSELPFDLHLSQFLSRRVKAVARECFQNAYEAMQRLPDATYVEGMTVPEKSPLAVEHAWLEREGKIIDPTFCGLPLPFPKGFKAEGRKKADGSIARAYFPVLRYGYDQLLEMLGKTLRTGFLPEIHRKDLFTDETRALYQKVYMEAFMFDIPADKQQQIIDMWGRVNSNQIQT